MKGRQRAARRRAKDKQAEQSQTATEGELLYRSAVVEIHKRGDEPVIGIAFSSESPVERFDFSTGAPYQEVLSHDPADVDLTRASDGLPLLIDHDGPQVALVKGIALGNDGRLRGTVVFGAHPDAEWVKQDMVSGIRSKVSVGYRVGDEVGERDGDVRRFAWTPLEVSSVSIPADLTVGVGRNRKTGMGDNMDKGTKDAAATRIQELGALARANDAADKLPGWLADDVSVSDAKNSIIDGLRSSAASSTPQLPIGGLSAPAIIGKRGDGKLVDLGRDALAGMLANNADLGQAAELNAEMERAHGYGARHGGVRIPYASMEPTHKRVVTSGSDPGSQLVATDLGQLIGPLTPDENLLVKLGATVLPGLQGDVSIPRITADGAAVFVAETAGSDQAAVDPSLDALPLSPKDLMAPVIVSRRSAAQTNSVDVIGASIRRALAKKLVDVGIEGNASNEPSGILTASGTTLNTLGANGAVMDFSDWVDLETQTANANADIPGRMSILTTPGVRGVARQLDRATNAGSFMWQDDNRVNGTPAFVSTAVPSDGTTGTSTTICHSCIMGNFSELLIGEWSGGIEVQVDPFTLSRQGKIVITGHGLFDLGLRHGASFTILTDILLS